MKIEQIMIKKVVVVKAKDKISEVAQVMTKYRIHGVPVVKKNKLVGIITETDFFVKDLPDLYLPSYINFLKSTKMTGNIKHSKKKEIKAILKATAKDIMTIGCITMSPEDDVSNMIKIIKEKHIFTFPVVDEENNLVGIVTQADIIKLI
jgi:CBS domain-containing protein